jgi:hypothetical protein
MNKTIHLLLLCVLTSSGFSQPFHGGVILGISASQVDGDSYAGYNKLGMQGGVFVSTALTPMMAACLEIKYTGRGARNPASDDNTGSYQLALHYIDLPVLLDIQTRSLVSVELGLIPGYLFAVQGKDDAGNLPDEYLVGFRKFDLGILVGLRFTITDKFAVNLRFSYSLFSIRDPESAGSYYSWFGKLFGHSQGDYNNYLTFGCNYLIK